MDNPALSIVAGAAGATVLTLVHEAGRHSVDDAPRMDVLGMRAMAAMQRRAGIAVDDRDTLRRQTLAADLVANSAYYALVGAGSREGIWARGLALGLLAGVGALVLPRPLGLGAPPSVESRRNQAMTIAYYTLGGLVAAATYDALSDDAAS